MKCEICGKEIHKVENVDIMIYTTSYTHKQRHFHKSCYDKSIAYSVEECPNCEGELVIQGGSGNGNKKSMDFREYLKCQNCGKHFTKEYKVSEQSPQEAKPTKESHWTKCEGCKMNFVTGTRHYCDIDSMLKKQSEPPAESTEVEEIEEIKSLQTYTPDSSTLHKKINELVRVVNRLAKEIKLKKKKDGL